MSPFDLNLRHLSGLETVAELGGVSAAAKFLNMSQPALTQGLLKLESQLGQVLLERRPAGVTPTEAGRLLVERARSALRLLTDGAGIVARSAGQAERRLSMTHLRAFLALADAGDYVNAGSRAGLSSTAVHRGVRDLESALGATLVEKRGRGVAINFAGHRFARACRLAVVELRAALAEIGIDAQRATVAVGTTPLTRAFLVPEAMALTLSSPDPASFQVFEGSWGELVETLRDGVIDLIVGELPPHDSPDLVKSALCEERVVIVAGRQHPLAGQQAPDLATLAGYPWIIAPENSPLRSAWHQLFAGRTAPSAPIECGSVMIIGRLLTSSTMLTLATPDQVALQITSGLLAQIPQADRHFGRLAVGVTTRHRWRPTAAQQRFLHELAATARRSGDRRAQPPRMAVDWNTVR